MDPARKKKSDIFGGVVFLALIAIAVVAYFNWQKESMRIPFVETKILSEEEIEEHIDAFVKSSKKDSDGGFAFPETQFIATADKYHILGSSSEATYIQSVNKDTVSGFDLSTVIPETNVTSSDFNYEKKLLAYTTKIKEGVVSGLFLVNPETLQKQVIQENIKDSVFVTDAQLSINGEVLSYIFHDTDASYLSFYILESNSFNKGSLNDEHVHIRSYIWTRQGEVIAITDQNKMLISVSTKTPYIFKEMNLIDLPEEYVYTEALVSPNENIVILTGETGENDDFKTAFLVYNIDTGTKGTEILFGKQRVAATWARDGKQLFISEDGDLYAYSRQDRFLKSESPLFEDAGEVEEQLDASHFVFKAVFQGTRESLLRFDIWDVNAKEKAFSTEPLDYAHILNIDKN